MFYCSILACQIGVFVGGSSSLSSASLYLREGWIEGKRKRGGDNGKGKET